MEKTESVAQLSQLPAAIAAFLAEHADALARAGSVVTRFHTRGGKKFGPYYKITCRNAVGHQLSAYLPRDSVERVRAQLSDMQAGHRARRRLAQARRQLRATWAEAKREMDAELAPLGLRRQGSEVRGWASVKFGKL